MRASGPQLRQLGALYDAGVLRPVIDKAFPFEQTSEAMTTSSRATPRPAKSSSRCILCPMSGRPRIDHHAMARITPQTD